MIATIQPMTGIPMIATEISRLPTIVDNAILAIDATQTPAIFVIPSDMICEIDHATVPSVTSAPTKIPTTSMAGAIGSTNSKKLIFRSSINACIRFCFSA